MAVVIHTNLGNLGRLNLKMKTIKVCRCSSVAKCQSSMCKKGPGFSSGKKVLRASFWVLCHCRAGEGQHKAITGGSWEPETRVRTKRQKEPKEDPLGSVTVECATSGPKGWCGVTVNPSTVGQLLPLQWCTGAGACGMLGFKETCDTFLSSQTQGYDYP